MNSLFVDIIISNIFFAKYVIYQFITLDPSRNKTNDVQKEDSNGA